MTVCNNFQTCTIPDAYVIEMCYSFVVLNWKLVMLSNVTGGASEVAAIKASQMHQATALVGVRTELKKDEEMVAMLKKSQQELQAITPSRGNSLNVKA